MGFLTDISKLFEVKTFIVDIDSDELVVYSREGRIQKELVTSTKSDRPIRLEEVAAQIKQHVGRGVVRHDLLISVPQVDASRLNEYSQKVFDLAGRYIKDMKFIGQEQSVAMAFENFSKCIFLYDWNGLWNGFLGFQGETLGDVTTFLRSDPVEVIVESLLDKAPIDFPSKYFNLKEFKSRGIDLVQMWADQKLWNVSISSDSREVELKNVGTITITAFENVMLTGIEKYFKRGKKSNI